MDKPTCKVCGKKHWSHEDHVWPAEVPPKKIEKVYPQSTDNGVVIHKKKFDRVAYQREYMRKRRAKK